MRGRDGLVTGDPAFRLPMAPKSPQKRALLCGLISPRSEPLIGHMDAVTLYA